LIQPGKTLEWTFEAPKPSNVKPFQVELGAYVGYGANLHGTDSPFGFGIGTRAGVLFHRIYLALLRGVECRRALC
jgi:hypothetical protein